jgi:hypothetical protein
MIIEEVKPGQKWSNVTRPQIVEVTYIVGKMIWYNILEQETKIHKKEYSKSIEHFTNSYIKL